MKRLPCLILILFVTTGYSQTGFYTRTFDFSRTENSRWEHPPLENLGMMLLDGYLTGKLKAYKFDVAHDEIKHAPIPKEQLADPWNPKYDYYQDDVVSYKGKMYIANTDILRGSRPPDSLNYWYHMNITGKVVSWHHYFPTASDSTTKSYLLSRLVDQNPELYDPWDEKMEYFNMDRVEHEGKKYVAKGNNFFGIIPGTNEDFWELLRSRVTLFQSKDLTIVRVLYHDQVPQMVSIRVLDPLTEVSKDLGLNFYSSDVVKYLAKVNQPALYLSDMGYVGSGIFLFDDVAKANFTRWVQAKLISKEVKLGKKAIVDPVEYNLFINAKPDEISQTTWYPVQDPATHDFTIIAGKTNTDYDYYTLPVVSITYASLEKLMPVARRPKTYKDIFADTFITSWIDTVVMDSIEVLPAVANVPDAFKQNYFDQLHFDYTDADPVVQSAVPALWELIKQSNTKFLPSQSYFPCNYNWNGTEIKFRSGEVMIADESVSVSHVIAPPTDLPKPGWKMKKVGVVYRINLTSSSERFYPTQLVVSFEEEPHTDLIDYRVDWQDVMKIIAGKKEFNTFVDGIKKASLNFKQTAVSYNQIRVR
ncbi:MAG TPA: hypothetical protein VFE50_24140 [Cyclobacteriaceae bacterium]|nr:hypothetical protein [Cyclobacteriaceae bacterium]